MIVYVKFSDDDSGVGASIPGINSFFTANIGSGLLSSNLSDENGQPSGISLSEGAQPFASALQSLSFADESPDARLPLEFFQGFWTAGGSGEKLKLGGFAAGQSATIELCGQNANSRNTIFSATNSSPASVTYEVQSDPDPDPFIATAPAALTVTADVNGEISINAQVVSVHPYLNGFILTFDELVQPTATLANDLQPGASFTLNYSNYDAVPVSPVTIRDSNNNSITVPVTINDNGDGTGTATGTMPSLPSSGTSQGLLFGNVTVELGT